MRFLTLHLITAPLNYKWQELLESTFPAYDRSLAGSLPLAERDVEKYSRARGDDADFEERSHRASKPRLNLKNTITKWFIDCITLGAVMNTGAFFIIMGILKGQTSRKIMHNIRTKMLGIIINGYKVWPIVSIISFSFIPVKHRIQFFSCIGLAWNVYGTVVAQNL